jgi:hypothetical protein
MVATVAMLAQAPRLPMARMQRLTQVMGGMDRGDQLKMKYTKGLITVMGTDRTV